MAQSVTAATVSVAHGVQDGQKTMLVLALALAATTPAAGAGPLVVTGVVDVPVLVQILVALALGIGTLAGGWPIVRTMSRRLVRVTPATGFAGEGVASSLIYLAAVVGIPLSTTQTVVASIVGAGATGGSRAVRWDVVGAVLLVALATPAATFAVAAGLVSGLQLF